MQYTVKWVKENLGISRNSIRKYEAGGLIHSPRGVINDYREYDENDIQRLWCIKCLIGIGYTIKEIHSIINDKSFDFYSSLSEKIEKLEAELKNKNQFLEFAKTIKLTGRIPIVSELGCINFDDFINYSKDNWNIYADSQFGLIAEKTEKLLSENSQKFNVDDLVSILEAIDIDMINMSAYYRLICDFKNEAYSDTLVQKVVKKLYEYFCNLEDSSEFKDSITPQKFAKYHASYFIEGDIAKLQEQNYGKDGCLFIANAVAYFGGYKNYDEI